MKEKYLVLFTSFFCINTREYRSPKNFCINTRKYTALKKDNTQAQLEYKNKILYAQKKAMQKIYNIYVVNVNNIQCEYNENLKKIVDEKSQCFTNEEQRNDNILNRNNNDEQAELSNLLIAFKKDKEIQNKADTKLDQKYIQNYIKITKKYNAIQKNTAKININNINVIERKYNQMQQRLKELTNKKLEKALCDCFDKIDQLQIQYHKAHYQHDIEFLKKTFKKIPFCYYKEQ